MPDLELLGISGSLRASSHNIALLSAATSAVLRKPVAIMGAAPTNFGSVRAQRVRGAA